MKLRCGDYIEFKNNVIVQIIGIIKEHDLIITNQIFNPSKNKDGSYMDPNGDVRHHKYYIANKNEYFQKAILRKIPKKEMLLRLL